MKGKFIKNRNKVRSLLVVKFYYCEKNIGTYLEDFA